jgi:hypothetical protein
VTALSRPRLITLVASATDVVPAFDRGGTAYLTSACDGVVLRAPPGSHRFGPPVTLAPGRVLGFNLSVSTRATGLASWIDGRCTQDVSAGDIPGPISSRVLAGGRFGPPVELASTPYGTSTVALASPDGSGSVSWGAIGPSDGGVFTRPLDAAGTFGAARAVPDGMVPFLATGGGDQVFAQALLAVPPLVTGAGGLVVRPAGGGPDQRAPAVGQVAVSAPVGRRAVVLWSRTPDGRELALSRWRP